MINSKTRSLILYPLTVILILCFLLQVQDQSSKYLSRDTTVVFR